MSRRRNDHRFPGLMGVLVLAVGTTVASAQDRIADWLEARSLDRLLVEHLEAQASVDSRDENVDTRLSEAYARLIEAETDEAIRDDLVTRARRLLAQMPASTSVPLRLALARVRYLGAQKVLERSRVAEVAGEEIERRRREMETIAVELTALAEELERRLISTQRRGGARAGRELDELAQLKGAASLLSGWCWYYRGCGGIDADLARAQRAFGSLLSGGDSIPDVDDLSDDRKSYEWYASAILGMAMTESARISPAAARSWFRALRTGDVHPAVAGIVDGWRLAALLDAGQFDDADRLLEELEGREGEVPAAWLRMAATGGLRGRLAGDGEAVRLYQRALAMLAMRREFSAIAALVGAFGLDSIDQRGFVFDYIRGLERYREAAEANRRGEEERKIAILSEAARDFESAIRASDVVNYPDAAWACRIQLAKTRLDLGAPKVTLDHLLEVIPEVSGEVRADAIWWAIVACDRILADPGQIDSTEIRSRRESLGRSFLEAYPTDERAPRLMIRRIVREEDPALEDLEILLTLSPDHPSWRSSRERALTSLYRRFRRAVGEERRSLGRRTIDVAKSLERPRSPEDLIDPVVATQRDRIVAEILTSEGLVDRIEAERVLDRLERSADREESAGLEDEILYRRLMLELLEEDFESALRLLAEMPRGPGPDAETWSDLAVRQVHATAVERARTGNIPMAVADAIVVSGERRFDAIQLEGKEPDWEEILDRGDLLAVAANLGTAHRAMFVRSGDPTRAEAALVWFMRALERRPNDRGLLESAAELSAVLDDRARTLDLWRRILRRADRSSPLWWKAKVGQIEAVLGEDPTQAARILQQVRALEPDLGPEPWRTRLLELSDRLVDPAVPDTSAGREGGVR